MKKSNEQKLGDVIRDLTGKGRMKDKLGEVKIRQLWEEEMGAFISKRTDDIRLLGDKLRITVSSASLRQELFMAREKIRERVNERLGEERVKEVAIY